MKVSCISNTPLVPVGTVADPQVLEVGVGYHHPPIQWLNRPMDARQWGNPAAVACQADPGLLGFCALIFTGASESLSPWLSSGDGQQCMLIRPMSYGRHRLRDASSLSLMRVDAVRAMRT